MSDQRESNPHLHLGKVALGRSTMVARYPQLFFDYIISVAGD